MDHLPDWLPARIDLDCTENERFERLATVWRADFQQGVVEFRGIPVTWDHGWRHDARMEDGFWHVVSKDSTGDGARTLDLERACRLSWLAPLLNNSEDAAVLAWENSERHGRPRTTVWLERGDYVAVLEARERADMLVMQLVTAFWVMGRATERRLRQGYNRSQRR